MDHDDQDHDNDKQHTKQYTIINTDFYYQGKYFIHKQSIRFEYIDILIKSRSLSTTTSENFLKNNFYED